ncbi:D-serine/D-alanine/glycine transporter [Enemella evansiae]|uniref:amino acid permease n=1 Tax=Enemella evansiae TaxID=2016499 RepID=UPI000B97B9D9|nr:amino acid permease [Enemella evansiae]OYN99441.1 D-serine/D-alanine/glycine transporter [Enemella evansiae]
MKSPAIPEHPESPKLERALGNRHIQLIAIGGAIGTGLFMGSGKTISVAGPSVLLVYLIIGFMLYFVMRAMGEILLSRKEYRNFADFTGDLLGPWAAFFTGWTYWFCWVVTAVADVIVIASVYVTHLLPNLPPWSTPVIALLVIAALIGLNLPTVRAFGETEFWFAMVKIVAILALIVVGVVLILSGFTSAQGTASFTHLWDTGGFFAKGFLGFVAAFQIATFAFVGIELVGTTAAETKDPDTNLPRAVRSIPIRILLFYIGSLVVLMSVMPWTTYDADNSPFIQVFDAAGLPAAAAVVNLVVLTSAMSSANSGIYSTSRMVYGLATQNDAPRMFARLSSRHVPRNALFLTAVVLLSSVVLLASGLGESAGFSVVTTVSSLCFMFVWTMILASYLVYRRRRPQDHAASRFRMPLGTVMPWIVFAFFGFLIWAFTGDPDTLAGLLATPVWFVLVTVGYLVVRRTPDHRAQRAEFRRQVAEEHREAERVSVG